MDEDFSESEFDEEEKKNGSLYKDIPLAIIGVIVATTAYFGYRLLRKIRKV